LDAGAFGNPLLLTSWPEIFCFYCVRALLARVFSIPKKAHPIRQLVNPAEQHSSSKGRGGYFRQPDSCPGNPNLAAPAIILARLL
jgi:hypothetical protein